MVDNDSALNPDVVDRYEASSYFRFRDDIFISMGCSEILRQEFLNTFSRLSNFDFVRCFFSVFDVASLSFSITLFVLFVRYVCLPFVRYVFPVVVRSSVLSLFIDVVRSFFLFVLVYCALSVFRSLCISFVFSFLLT